MRVLAVDPGKTTGWACLGAEKPLDPSHGEMEEQRFLDWAESLVNSVDVVVCEAYVITGHTLRVTRQNWSLEQIGVLRWLSRRREVLFVLQTAADAKRFMTDSKLRALGWWDHSDHARDALRHLGLYLVREGVLDPARLL